MNRLFALLSVTLVLALYMLVFNIELQEPKNLGVVTISSDLVTTSPDLVTIVPTVFLHNAQTSEPEATIGPAVTIVPIKNNLVTILPTATVPPKDIACQQQLAPWSNELSLVMQKFQKAIELGSNNDHFTAKDTVASAILMYQNLTPPPCDQDAITYHQLIGVVLSSYMDAYTAAFNAQDEKAHALFSHAHAQLVDANEVFALLKKRYNT